MKNQTEPECRLFFLQTLSPLHVGVGEGTGYINLPTAREVTTQYPYVAGSSIKGVLREEAELQTPVEDNERYGNDPVVLAFGPPSSRAGDARGGLVLTDARLLFLPMRSLVGGFALVSCPLILRRLARDARLAGLEASALDALLKENIRDSGCLVTKESALVHNKEALLEDVALQSRPSGFMDELGVWLAGKAWDQSDGDFYAQRLVLISDSLFGFFVRLHLEVRSRVHLNDDTGTAAASGPWLEEYIPAEALLFGLAQGRRTALRMKAPKADNAPRNGNAQDPNSADNADESYDSDKDFVRKASKDSLDVLAGLFGATPLLRFGGKASGGAGRAFFRLVKA